MNYGNDLHQLNLDFFKTAEIIPVFLVGLVTEEYLTPYLI